MTAGIPNIELRHLYRLEASLDTKMEIGTGPYGFRRCITVSGGTFEGDRVKGTVLPGGADHMIVGDDETAYVDTRYNLKTHDGAMIYIQTKGVRSGPPDVLNALLAGEQVEPHKYDFHLHVFLETGDERYWWLNKAIIVGRAVRSANGIAYDAYEVVTSQI